MRYYEYHWLHVPTQVQGTNVWLVGSKEEFLELLNKNNAAAPGIWQYWEK